MGVCSSFWACATLLGRIGGGLNRVTTMAEAAAEPRMSCATSLQHVVSPSSAKVGLRQSRLPQLAQASAAVVDLRRRSGVAQVLGGAVAAARLPNKASPTVEVGRNTERPTSSQTRSRGPISSRHSTDIGQVGPESAHSLARRRPMLVRFAPISARTGRGSTNIGPGGCDIGGARLARWPTSATLATHRPKVARTRSNWPDSDEIWLDNDQPRLGNGRAWPDFGQV